MTNIVLTDPPYGATKLSWDRFQDTLTILKNLEKNVDAMIVFANHRLLQNLLKTLTLSFHDIVIWDKEPRRAWVSWRKPLHHIEFITFWGPSKYFDFRKSLRPHPPYKRRFSRIKGGKQRVNNFSFPMFNQIWKIKDVPKKEKIHPTQKPLELIDRLVAIISKNQDLCIIDPFEGSSPLRSLQQKYGFKYIGNDTREWEINNPYSVNSKTVNLTT